MFFSSIKGINRLVSDGMWNIYLEVIIEEIWLSQNIDILSLKICLQASFWGAPTHADIIELKKINFNENEMESKMGNPTHSFRETNLVLQLRIVN